MVSTPYFHSARLSKDLGGEDNRLTWRSTFAIRLSAILRTDQDEADILAQEQRNLVRAIFGSGSDQADRTIDLRYRCVNAPDRPERRSVEITYVCGCSGKTRAESANQADVFWRDLRLCLPGMGTAYEFEPIVSRDDLMSHLDSSEYRYWAEIRRRCDRVRFSRSVTVGVVNPFAPSRSSRSGLVRTLYLLDDNVSLSVRLKAAGDRSLEQQVIADAVMKGTGTDLDNLSQEQALQALANQRYHLHALQDPALCEMRIRVACAHPIQPALINIVGNETTALIGMHDIDGFAAVAGGYESTVAVGKSDVIMLQRDHQHVDCTDWQDHESECDFGRLPYLVNPSEAVCAFALPSPNSDGFMGIPSLRVKAAATLPAFSIEGISIGRTRCYDAEVDVRFPLKDRRRHQYVVGQTGTGKSTLLLSMICADIADGHGVCVIDPHGDLVEDVLGRIPESRIDDVVLFDPSDADYPMGLNLFEWKTPSQKDFLVQECVNIFYKLFDPGRIGMIGPQFEHWMRNGALTLMASPEGGTIIEIARLFSDFAASRKGGKGEFVKAKRSHVADVSVRDFWSQLDATADFHISEMLNYFVSKFGRFYGNEMIRNITGQFKSGFDFRQVMDSKGILLVNLSKGLVGEENSKLLGMILTTKIQMAAMSRADVPLLERQDFFVYVDEFQNFTTDSFATMLSEARKYRTSLILANQFIKQLTEPVRDAVFGNAGTFICFRLGAQDAPFMAGEFAPAYSEEDLKRLPNHYACAKLLIDGYPSDPFILANVLAERRRNQALMDEVRTSSRSRLTRSSESVSQDIEHRLLHPQIKSSE